MKTALNIRIAGLFLAVFIYGAGRAMAGSDSWKADIDGNWADTNNWAAGCAPGSTGRHNNDFAMFGFALKNDRIVTVDTNRFIGNIAFGNPSVHGYTLAQGTLRLSNTDTWNQPGGIIQTLAGNGAHVDTINSAVVFYNMQYGLITADALSPNSVLRINGGVTSHMYQGVNLTLNGINMGANTIAGVIIDNDWGYGTLRLIKSGVGNWRLSGANTYSGGTMVNGGMLTLDAGAGGSLKTGSALTFSGTGVFNYDNMTAAGAKSQSLGALTNRVGEGTVQLTRTAAQNVALMFTSFGARSVGATRNFVYAGTPGMIGSNSTITIKNTAAGFIDQNSFVDGGDFAYVNGAGKFVRVPVYGADEG
ncbi:MAG: autotransporter-associated beta strand repeat-containing protein [bacterium]